MNAGFVTVAASEVQRLFRQPLAWMVLAAGQGLMAIYFFLLIVRYLEQPAGTASRGVTVDIVTSYFMVANLSIVLITPILSMNTIAAERRDGMLRFLYSTPLTSGAIIGGKLAALLALAFSYLALISVLPLTLLWGAPIDLGVYAGNVVGLVLFAILHNSLGLMASALTRVPIASGLIALAVSLVLWLGEWANTLDPQASTYGTWSTLARLRGFSQGLLISADVAYFCVLSVALVAVSMLLLEADRKLT